MCTSMLELNARVTWASRVITLPNFGLCLKETLSTDAVTTMRLECFCAAMADTISIQCIMRPPIKLCRVLVSLGNTSSVIMVYDSLTFFCFRILFWQAYKKNTAAKITLAAVQLKEFSF